MKRLPCGSAAAPTGFGFKHLKAALQRSMSYRDHTIESVNKVLSYHLVQGRDIVFRQNSQSIAKSAEKDSVMALLRHSSEHGCF